MRKGWFKNEKSSFWLYLVIDLSPLHFGFCRKCAIIYYGNRHENSLVEIIA
jgi:hypothetical protein